MKKMLRILCWTFLITFLASSSLQGICFIVSLDLKVEPEDLVGFIQEIEDITDYPLIFQLAACDDPTIYQEGYFELLVDILNVYLEANCSTSYYEDKHVAQLVKTRFLYNEDILEAIQTRKIMFRDWVSAFKRWPDYRYSIYLDSCGYGRCVDEELTFPEEINLAGVNRIINQFRCFKEPQAYIFAQTIIYDHLLLKLLPELTDHSVIEFKTGQISKTVALLNRFFHPNSFVILEEQNNDGIGTVMIKVASNNLKQLQVTFQEKISFEAVFNVVFNASDLIRFVIKGKNYFCTLDEIRSMSDLLRVHPSLQHVGIVLGINPVGFMILANSLNSRIMSMRIGVDHEELLAKLRKIPVPQKVTVEFVPQQPKYN